MSGELPFLDIDGVEIANGYRTLEYLRRGLGGVKWEVPEVYPCQILAREVGGVAPFVSPSVDPAPWYDSTIPESAQFLGLISKLDFQTLTIKRNTTQRFGSIGGGVIGIEQFAVRNLHVDGMLIASSCAGLEYGRHWLYSKLGSDCLGCGLRIVRVRESCPPADGTNDTRGERIMYDSALIAGITRTDNGGAQCCDYDGIQFDIASQSPYLYSRAGAPTSPVSIQSSGGFAPQTPATLDTGTRANTGPPPSASWTYPVVTGFTNNLKIVSNTFQITVGSVAAAAYWNPATYGPDSAAGFTLAALAANSQVGVIARLTTPGINTGQGVFGTLHMVSAGNDFVTIGRIHQDGSTALTFGSPTTFTAAVGDKYMLTARGSMIEFWRLPSGGAWIRLAAFYDETTPVAGNVAMLMGEQGTSPQVTNFFGGTLNTNSGIWPVDVITVPVPAVPVGIVSPIVTVTAPLITGPTRVAHDVRVQLKTGSVDCFQQDDFAVDDLAARWTQSVAANWQITGGKLKPLVTGPSGSSGRRIARSKDSAAKTIAWQGGKVQATIKTATTIASGVWGVGWAASPSAVGLYGAFLTQANGTYTNVFTLNNDPQGGAGLDSVAFTPVANTTYLIICEMLPLATGVGYDLRGYLVDPATMQLLVRPLRSTIGVLNAVVPPFMPMIASTPRDVNEEWDSFYAIDSTDSPDYINISIPPGTLILDASRRVSKFTGLNQNGNTLTTSTDGSAYLSSPIDVPLGWVDLCAGAGPGCIQIWGDDTVLYASTVSVALQQRQR